MRDIELPITQTYSVTVDLQKLGETQPIDDGDGKWIVPIGNIVDEEACAITSTALRNGGKILYATTSIERQLDQLLLHYFMGPFEEHSDKRVMFESEILQSTALSFSAKKELVAKVVNDAQLLVGKKKNRFQGNLKKIMNWRNAFAHGRIQHDNATGCFIHHYSGAPKKLVLDDKFWDEVEVCFTECSELLKYAYGELDKKA